MEVVEPRYFIHNNALEAWTYISVFALTVVLPTITSLITNSNELFFFAMFLSSLSNLRQNLLLIKHKKCSSFFWWERLIVLVLSAIVSLYSCIGLYSILYDVFKDVTTNIIKLIFVFLFLLIGFSSFLEAILLTRLDYKRNVINSTEINNEATVHLENSDKENLDYPIIVVNKISECT